MNELDLADRLAELLANDVDPMYQGERVHRALHEYQTARARRKREESMTTKTLGQIAFEAYNESRGGLTHDGKKTPPWEDLGDGVRHGWERASHAAAYAVLESLVIPAAGSTATSMEFPPTNEQRVAAFMRAMETPIPATPRWPDPVAFLLGRRLIEEEWEELKMAWLHENFVEFADGVIDLLYVVYWMGHLAGLPLEALFAEVHRANMNKLGPDGRPIKNAFGKVQKPAGWKPPNIAAVLRTWGWKGGAK